MILSGEWSLCGIAGRRSIETYRNQKAGIRVPGSAAQRVNIPNP